MLSLRSTLGRQTALPMSRDDHPAATSFAGDAYVDQLGDIFAVVSWKRRGFVGACCKDDFLYGGNRIFLFGVAIRTR